MVGQKCDDLLNLILNKCQWLSGSVEHSKCFGAFTQFCLSLLAHQSCVPLVLRHVLVQFSTLAQ